MANKEIYYVYKSVTGKYGRVAKFVDGIPYGYDDGEWVSMPGLYKIQNDVTAYYYEITKEEAERIINAE